MLAEMVGKRPGQQVCNQQDCCLIQALPKDKAGSPSAAYHGDPFGSGCSRCGQLAIRVRQLLHGHGCHQHWVCHILACRASTQGISQEMLGSCSMRCVAAGLWQNYRHKSGLTACKVMQRHGTGEGSLLLKMSTCICPLKLVCKVMPYPKAEGWCRPWTHPPSGGEPACIS